MAKLVLKFDERVLGEYPVVSDVTIGRLLDNTIVIDNPAVSGHHARIVLDGADYIVEDLRSKNGTYVNGKHVLRAALQNRDVLLIGKHTVVFDQVANAEPMPASSRLPTLGKTTYLNTKKHRELLARLRAERAGSATSGAPASPSQTSPYLRIVGGQADQQEYRLQHPISFIGNSDEALVRLHGFWKPKTAAAIVQHDTGFTVTDFDGSTLVNNQTLPDGSLPLQDGDILEVGGLVMQFGLPESRSAEPEATAETA